MRNPIRFSRRRALLSPSIAYDRKTNSVFGTAPYPTYCNVAVNGGPIGGTLPNRFGRWRFKLPFNPPAGAQISMTQEFSGSLTVGQGANA